jgi:hypothetical protein
LLTPSIRSHDHQGGHAGRLRHRSAGLDGGLVPAAVLLRIAAGTDLPTAIRVGALLQAALLPSGSAPVIGPDRSSAGPPPRYKSPKRPFRLVPLLVAIVLAAVVLGSSVNFMVESVLKISRVHIKVQMFRVFQRILTPTLVLIAAPVFTIVVLPIHRASFSPLCSWPILGILANLTSSVPLSTS